MSEPGSKKVVPMIHVPDVRATVEWYASIGFEVQQTHEPDGAMSWAWLSFGGSGVMFNEGGKSSAEPRREVDLYAFTDDVEALRQRLDGRAEIVEDVHDTEYGMRELIIRDLNRFWITFGQA